MTGKEEMNPEEQARYDRFMCMLVIGPKGAAEVAGALIHYVMQPEKLQDLLTWLRETGQAGGLEGLADASEHDMVTILHAAHDILAPQCELVVPDAAR